MNNTLKENVQRVRERISIAAEKVGKKGDDILLVAVSKLHPIERIYQAQLAGIEIFGENRVQELLQKISISDKKIRWHLVGHLQTNKVNKVINQVEMIQSVDSIHLIEKLAASGIEKKLIIKVLIQVNTSGEESKFGFQPEIVQSVCEKVEQLSNIEVRGLMTIGPLTDNESEIARSFKKLRLLHEKLATYNSNKIKMDYLSMGMTGDYEMAIQEGSNLVRIGTAIFGPRS